MTVKFTLPQTCLAMTHNARASILQIVGMIPTIQRQILIWVWPGDVQMNSEGEQVHGRDIKENVEWFGSAGISAGVAG